MLFLKYSEDLVTLADGQEGGWFDGFVNDCLGLLPNHFARVMNFLSVPFPPPLSNLKSSLPPRKLSYTHRFVQLESPLRPRRTEKIQR